LLEHLFRQQAGRMVAHLARLLGPAHLDLAEEVVQETMLRALQSWLYQGVPENAAAWLFRVAHNAAIDAVRRTRLIGKKAEVLVAELAHTTGTPPDDPDFEEQLRDDELRMIFMCCHPEIPRDASVALSLKIAGGFGVREIARAFLAEDAAVAQRLVRAKAHIRKHGLTLEMPRGPELKRRLDSVLEVIYFIFNEGYGVHEGEELIRHDLCLEALRLGRLVASSSVSAPRVHALVALMALQAARLPARVDEAGDLVLLDSQDRGRWDRCLIALGFHHFDRSMAGEEVSEYHVQAAIAATHARAAHAEGTDCAGDSAAVRSVAGDQRVAGGRAEPRGSRSQSARPGCGAGSGRRARQESEAAPLLSAAGGPRAPAARTRTQRRSRGLLPRCIGLPLFGPRAQVSFAKTGRMRTRRMNHLRGRLACSPDDRLLYIANGRPPVSRL
jgi:RNA polymerase sigma-70 factor (ECF subfamily)